MWRLRSPNILYPIPVDTPLGEVVGSRFILRASFAFDSPHFSWFGPISPVSSPRIRNSAVFAVVGAQYRDPGGIHALRAS
jgi:hypothetical protein